MEIATNQMLLALLLSSKINYNSQLTNKDQKIVQKSSNNRVTYFRTCHHKKNYVSEYN